MLQEEANIPYLSLVLPAYNEEENISEAVSQAVVNLERITPDWEIVLVNDASTDSTGALAEQLAASHGGRMRVLHLKTNSGLGGALRVGFASARGGLIAYCDSDLPFDMATFIRAHEKLIEDKADLICGYRTNRSDEGIKRLLYSRAYNLLIRKTFGLAVTDVNFALKLFRREVFERANLKSTGSFVDVELQARAREEGFKTSEIGVVYTPRTRGTSTLARPAVIIDILREMALYKIGKLPPSPMPEVGKLEWQKLDQLVVPES